MKNTKNKHKDKERILSTNRDKEVFFNALFEADVKPNEALIELAEEYNESLKNLTPKKPLGFCRS